MVTLMVSTMQPMPMLKPMRTLRSLSQRALAKKSGVAHDTIGQNERGERLARPETVRKLGAALEVDPFILTSTHEQIVHMWESFQTGSVGYSEGHPYPHQIRDYLVHAGILEEQASASLVEQRIGPVFSAPFEDFDDVIMAVGRATEKLVPFDSLYQEAKAAPKTERFLELFPTKYSREAEIDEGLEAALLLARSSSRLLQLLADQLEVAIRDRTSSVPRLDELGRSLVDAWLEGSAATKEVMDTIDNISRSLGESPLEGQSEKGGSDQEG